MSTTETTRPLRLAVITETYPPEINGVANTMRHLVTGLRNLWRNAPPDVAYIETQGPLGRAALRAAESLSIPTVTGFHTQFDQYSRHYGLGFITRPIEASLRRFHNSSDTTLAPTTELRDGLMARRFARVEVFGRGVDTAQFSPERRRQDLRSAWGCGAAARTV